MELQYNEMQNGIRTLKLTGRLDIIGTGEIESEFYACCAGEKPLVVVDLAEVEFLASSGIRLFTLAAKSIASRGGRMVLINPIPEVQHILETADIPAVIPVYSHYESAEAVLTTS